MFHTKKGPGPPRPLYFVLPTKPVTWSRYWVEGGRGVGGSYK